MGHGHSHSEHGHSHSEHGHSHSEHGHGEHSDCSGHAHGGDAHGHSHGGPRVDPHAKHHQADLGGGCTAYLTALLDSKKGHALAIYITGPGDVSLGTVTPRLEADVSDFRGERPLIFEPAPASERPQGEAEAAPWSCSHFVAKALRMVREAGPLKISASFILRNPRDGTDRTVCAVWPDFYPAKYASLDV